MLLGSAQSVIAPTWDQGCDGIETTHNGMANMWVQQHQQPNKQFWQVEKQYNGDELTTETDTKLKQQMAQIW